MLRKEPDCRRLRGGSDPITFRKAPAHSVCSGLANEAEFNSDCEKSRWAVVLSSNDIYVEYAEPDAVLTVYLHSSCSPPDHAGR